MRSRDSRHRIEIILLSKNPAYFHTAICVTWLADDGRYSTDFSSHWLAWDVLASAECSIFYEWCLFLQGNEITI